MNKEILDLVYTLESELDDAYNCLPEYRANVDSQSCIDYARSTLYDLKDKVTGKDFDNSLYDYELERA